MNEFDTQTPSFDTTHTTPSATPKGFTPLREAARKLILEGKTADQAAVELDISIARVRQWCTRGKWKKDSAIVQKAVQSVVLANTIKSLSIQRTKESVRARRLASKTVEQHLEALASDTPTLASMSSSKLGEGSASVVLKTVQAAAVVHGWGKEDAESGEWSDLDALEPEQPAIDIESVKVKAD